MAEQGVAVVVKAVEAGALGTTTSATRKAIAVKFQTHRLFAVASFA